MLIPLRSRSVLGDWPIQKGKKPRFSRDWENIEGKWCVYKLNGGDWAQSGKNRQPRECAWEAAMGALWESVNSTLRSQERGLKLSPEPM